MWLLPGNRKLIGWMNRRPVFREPDRRSVVLGLDAAAAPFASSLQLEARTNNRSSCASLGFLGAVRRGPKRLDPLDCVVAGSSLGGRSQMTLTNGRMGDRI